MLSLADKGLGVDKGIPTLVIAAASVDDVLAISGFGVFLGMTFSAKGKHEFMLSSLYPYISLILYYFLFFRRQPNSGHHKRAT